MVKQRPIELLAPAKNLSVVSKPLIMVLMQYILVLPALVPVLLPAIRWKILLQYPFIE